METFKHHDVDDLPVEPGKLYETDLSIVWLEEFAIPWAFLMAEKYPSLFSVSSCMQGKELSSRDCAAEHSAYLGGTRVLFTRNHTYATLALIRADDDNQPRDPNLEADFTGEVLLYHGQPSTAFQTLLAVGRPAQFVPVTKVTYTVPTTSADSFATDTRRDWTDFTPLKVKHPQHHVYRQNAPFREGIELVSLFSILLLRVAAATWLDMLFDESLKLVRPKLPTTGKRRWKRAPIPKVVRMLRYAFPLDKSGYMLVPSAPRATWDWCIRNSPFYYGPGDLVPQWMSNMSGRYFDLYKATPVGRFLDKALLHGSAQMAFGPLTVGDWHHAWCSLNAKLGQVRQQIGLREFGEALPPDVLGPRLRKLDSYPRAGHMAWALTHLDYDGFLVQWAFMLFNLWGISPVMPTRSPVFDPNGVGVRVTDETSTLLWVPGMNHSAQEYAEAVFGRYSLFGNTPHSNRIQLIAEKSDLLWRAICEGTELDVQRANLTFLEDGLSYPSFFDEDA